MAVSIFLVSLFCGGYAVATQAYLAREFLVVFLGNEMSLAVLLAGWLCGVAAGARFGRSRLCRRARPAYLMAIVLPAWVALFPLAVVAVRVSRITLGVAPGMLAGLGRLLTVGVFFAGPFAAFGGLSFATLCRLADYVKGRINPVGLVYIAEAAGGVAGGALFTFMLAAHRDPFTFGFAAYLVQGIALVFLVYRASRSALLSEKTALTVMIGSFFVAVAGVGVWLGGRGAVLERNTALVRMSSIAEGRVVDTRESRFQNLTAVTSDGQYTVYGNGEPVVTFPEAVLNERDAYLALTEQGAPRDALVIGGGPDFLPSVLSYGVKTIDYVELDREVVAISQPYLEDEALAALESANVRVHSGDAGRFVRRATDAGRAYDVVFLVRRRFF